MSTQHRRKSRWPRYASVVAISAAVAGGALLLAVFLPQGHSHSSDRGLAEPSSPRPAITLTVTATATVSKLGAATPESPAAVATPSATTSPSTITYTVKPGDTLTAIAAWFHAHSYQPIYSWNQTVIGKDPSLIRPGQVLIVAVQ
jgi:LysM repeat protein